MLMRINGEFNVVMVSQKRCRLFLFRIISLHLMSLCCYLLLLNLMVRLLHFGTIMMRLAGLVGKGNCCMHYASRI